MSMPIDVLMVPRFRGSVLSSFLFLNCDGSILRAVVQAVPGAFPMSYGEGCWACDWPWGRQWPALEVGSARPLAIPTETRLAAAAPFHGCLVSPGSREATYSYLPNHEDKSKFRPCDRTYSVTEVTLLGRAGPT